MPVAPPERGEVPRLALPDEEELDHHSEQDDCALVEEALALDLVKPTSADDALELLEVLGRIQKVDVSVGTGRDQAEDLLGPAAEEPAVSAVCVKLLEDSADEGEVVGRPTGWGQVSRYVLPGTQVPRAGSRGLRPLTPRRSTNHATPPTTSAATA